MTVERYVRLNNISRGIIKHPGLPVREEMVAPRPLLRQRAGRRNLPLRLVVVSKHNLLHSPSRAFPGQESRADGSDDCEIRVSMISASWDPQGSLSTYLSGMGVESCSLKTNFLAFPNCPLRVPSAYPSTVPVVVIIETNDKRRVPGRKFVV